MLNTQLMLPPPSPQDSSWGSPCLPHPFKFPSNAVLVLLSYLCLLKYTCTGVSTCHLQHEDPVVILVAMSRIFRNLVTTISPHSFSYLLASGSVLGTVEIETERFRSGSIPISSLFPTRLYLGNVCDWRLMVAWTWLRSSLFIGMRNEPQTTIYSWIHVIYSHKIITS